MLARRRERGGPILLVARSTRTFATAGTLKIKLKLTKPGKRLLTGAKRLTLTANATFTPAGNPAVTTRRPFTIRQ